MHKEIKIKILKIKGTKIPISTINRFQSQKIKPTKKTLHKIALFYIRMSNAQLKISGASKYAISKYGKTLPEKKSEVISQYSQIVHKILAEKLKEDPHQFDDYDHDPIDFLRAGMMRSFRQSVNDWDLYLKDRYKTTKKKPKLKPHSRH